MLPITMANCYDMDHLISGLKVARNANCLLVHFALIIPKQSCGGCNWLSRGCDRLKGNIEARAETLGNYIIENRATVREAAKKFGISKSTVHKDLTERLQYFNRGMYLQVKEVLEINKAERHLRGGMATRNKYRKTG